MTSSCKGQEAYNPAGWWLRAHLCSACRGVRGKTTHHVQESCFNTPRWDTAGRRSPSGGRQQHAGTHRFVSQLLQLLDVGGDEGVQVLQDLLHLQRRQQEAESLHQPHALACLGRRGDTSRVTASHRHCPEVSLPAPPTLPWHSALCTELSQPLWGQDSPLLFAGAAWALFPCFLSLPFPPQNVPAAALRCP